MAATVSTVSRSDSPLLVEDPLPEMLMTSAESHLPAISKEDRVRVESSKKRLTTVRPRSVGSFLTSRRCTSCIDSAVVEQLEDLVGAEVVHREQVPHQRSPPLMRTSSTPSCSDSRTCTRSLLEVGRFLPTWSARIGSSRWPAVDEDGQPHGAGPAEVGERVERGADGAPGEQHVVDEDDDAVVDAGRRDVGVLDGADRLPAQVVAVHRDVERPDRHA